MTGLFDVMDFIVRARRRLRFGSFSREPLRLLRVEWKGVALECDWLMRAADSWDRFIPERTAAEQQSQQALRDALRLRDLVFKSFPGVVRAHLRMFRLNAENRYELVMAGVLNRFDEVMRRIPSIAMRARLCGFEFTLTKGVLECINGFSIDGF